MGGAPSINILVSTRPSLSFRVRYEGKVKVFDRRSQKELEAEEAKTAIHYIVAHTLSPFRKKTPTPPPPKPMKKRGKKSAISAVARGK